MKRLILLCALISVSLASLAQTDFYLGLHTDVGAMNKQTITNGIPVLGKKGISPHMGTNLSLHIRKWDWLSVELGIGQQFQNLRVKDADFEATNDGFSVTHNNKNYYYNYYAALRAMMRIERTQFYLYAQGAYSFNNYGNSTVDQTKPFQIAKNGIDQTISSTTTYNGSNASIIPEIGIQKRIRNRHMLSLGFKYNVSQDEILNGNYKIEDNLLATNNVISDNDFAHDGSFWAINMRFNYNLHYIPKREKEKKKKEPKEKKEKKPKVKKEKKKKDDPIQLPDPEKDPEPDPKPDPVPDPPKNDDNPTDRKLNVTHKIKVKSNKITLSLWDHQIVDGDRIKLALNGEWILLDYTLEKKKKVIEIQLKPGVNTVILHALNLGKYNPNTAAVIVNDGEKEQRLVLESDLEESGTLEILYKPKN